jgi:Holliday junction resolvase RusA-like endonuclease
MLNFTIPGEPIAKGRARVYSRNGFTRAVTPEKTVIYENLVKEIAFKKMRELNLNLIETPVKMEITAYFGIPKSTSKKKHDEMMLGKIRPVKRPDIDNCTKAIADALNGIVYKDDSQIVALEAEKYYYHTPHVTVNITPLDILF